MEDERALELGEAETRSPRLRWYAKALILFHLFAITVWALPNPPERVISGEEAPHGTQHLLLWNGRMLKSQGFLQAYLFSTGAWQYWDMFSPNPASVDIYGEAYVVFRDGGRAKFPYPRMQTLPIHERFYKERYRKFFERVREDRANISWPSVAQRIALLAAKDPQNPPIKVELYRTYLTIAPPGQPQKETYTPQRFFTYVVDWAKLARAKGWPAR